MFKKKTGIIALILCIILTMGYFAINTRAVSTVLLAIQGAITDGNLVKFSGTNGIGVDTGLSTADVADAVTKKHAQNADTDLDPTFEATFVKKADTVNVLSDITSTGANIEDAVTKKHTAGTDTILGTLTADINMGTHKLTGLSVPSASGQSVRTTATITEANLEDAINKKHTQNTDTTLVFTNALASDHTYSGEVDSQPVGESVVFGDLLYFNCATVTGDDIAFVDGGEGEDTITQVAAKFLEIGLVAGDVITVTGATEEGNNDTFTIVSVIAGTINIATGSLTEEVAGATVTITSPYEWKKAKADAYATTPAERIALETKANSETCLMLVKGYIRDDSAFDFGASRIFLNDDTAGTCDDTAPAEIGDQIQVVGTAKSADILFFNPSVDVGEI